MTESIGSYARQFRRTLRRKVFETSSVNLIPIQRAKTPCGSPSSLRLMLSRSSMTARLWMHWSKSKTASATPAKNDFQSFGGRPKTSSRLLAILNPDGLFHAILTAAADQFIGVTRRSTRQYTLVYRSVDRKKWRQLCADVKKHHLSPKIARHAPIHGFAPDIEAFDASALELQDKRHATDCDPSIRVKRSDASLALRTARTALTRFSLANVCERESFLSLLLFQPR